MQDVTEAMSRMASLRSGALVLNREVLPVRDLVADALAASQGAILKNEHTVECSVPEESLHVHGDRGLLVDALMEILDNAARFTEEPATLELACTADLDHVFLTVTDPGIGIPEEGLPRVFDAFYQVEDHLTRAHGGLGLGLTIAREIVHLHGGTVAVDSDGPGHGATVTVTLPFTVPA